MVNLLQRRKGALSFFIPDLYVHEIADIDADMLRNSGIKLVISDIDNTLAPYENELPPEMALELYSRLERAGIGIALVSNNNAERVERYNCNTRFPAVSKAGKPRPAALVRLMRESGVSRDETVMLGDQIFTDVCAGRAAGVRCILVDPIKDRTDAGTRLKRVGELPLKHIYRKKEKIESYEH